MPRKKEPEEIKLPKKRGFKPAPPPATAVTKPKSPATRRYEDLPVGIENSYVNPLGPTASIGLYKTKSDLLAARGFSRTIANRLYLRIVKYCWEPQEACRDAGVDFGWYTRNRLKLDKYFEEETYRRILRGQHRPLPDMHGKQAHRKPTLLPLDKETWFHFGTMSYSSLEIQNRYYCTSSVYYEHLKSHPELKEAFERGKFEADAIVHASLLKSATGYSYKKKKHFAHQGIVTSDVMETVHVSPSVPAQIFHITNKRTDWRHGDGQVKSDQKAAILEALEGLTQENESD